MVLSLCWLHYQICELAYINAVVSQENQVKLELSEGH